MENGRQSEREMKNTRTKIRRQTIKIYGMIWHMEKKHLISSLLRSERQGAQGPEPPVKIAVDFGGSAPQHFCIHFACQSVLTILPKCFL